MATMLLIAYLCFWVGDMAGSVGKTLPASVVTWEAPLALFFVLIGPAALGYLAGKGY